MGTSVINPMIFYWMNVLCNLDFVVNVVGIALTILLLGRLILYVTGIDDILNYPNSRTEIGEKIITITKKGLKANIILIFICLTITTFIPSEETMLTILVADMVTYENIELTKESAMALVNYIVEQVKAITG